jgi:O-antigen/teichoic acid export membrane protein
LAGAAKAITDIQYGEPGAFLSVNNNATTSPSYASLLKNKARRELLKLVKGAAFVFACRVAGAATVFVTQVLLARWMGAGELGIYVLAFSWCTMLAALAVLGFPPAALRFIGNALALGKYQLIKGFIRSGTQTIVAMSLVVSLAGCAAIVMVEGLVLPAHQTTMILAVLSVPLFALLRWFASVTYAYGWFLSAVVPDNLLRPLFLLLATAAFWYWRQGLASDDVMLMHIGVVVLVLAVLVIFLAKRLKPTLAGLAPEFEYRLWIQAAVPLMIITLFNNYFMEINIIIAGMHLEAEQLAVFNVSYRTAFMISLGIYAIDTITLPHAAKLFAKSETAALESYIMHATRLKLAGAILGVAILAVAGEYILGFFGANFMDGYRALLILAAGQVIIAAMGPLTQLLSISGHQNHCFYVFFSTLVVLLILHRLLIAHFGIDGAALAVVLVILAQSVWLYFIVVRHLDIHPAVFTFSRRTR